MPSPTQCMYDVSDIILTADLSNWTEMLRENRQSWAVPFTRYMRYTAAVYRQRYLPHRAEMPANLEVLNWPDTQIFASIVFSFHNFLIIGLMCVDAHLLCW